MYWTHLQYRWIKNTNENLRRKMVWWSTSREAKGQMESSDDNRCQKTARDRRIEEIGIRTENLGN
jgi:hypothetical protein